MTLEMLIQWHQQRAGDCFAILARATHMPKIEADVKATAQFHIEAVPLLQTLVFHSASCQDCPSGLQRRCSWQSRQS
jgi:hypothetical protein